MNCEKANQLSIIEYLQTRGINPKRKYRKHWWFLSPIRKETNPSFVVDLQKNTWYDKAEDKGGDMVALVKELHSTDTSGALEILGRNEIKPFSFDEQHYEDNKVPAIQITRQQDIRHPALIEYLHERKIPVEKARRYLREAHYLSADRNKRFFSLAFRNDAGGFALRNRFSKTAISPAHFTTIHGTSPERSTLNIFEGVFDFLTALVYYRIPVPTVDCMILNSTVHGNKIDDVLRKYQKINLFLDNDTTGRRLTEQISRQHPKTTDFSFVYDGFNDFNEFLISKKS
jgi:hypothetical protein